MGGADSVVAYTITSFVRSFDLFDFDFRRFIYVVTIYRLRSICVDGIFDLFITRWAVVLCSNVCL